MATHWFYGYAPGSFTSPQPGTMQLDPGWDVQDDAYDFHITDNDSDTDFQGDATNNESGDDTDQQTGVVYDENGSVVASGRAYLEEAYVLTDGYGNTVRLYRVEIGGTHVGYIADGPIQPGNTYTLSSTENVDNSNAPQYSNLEDQSYDEDAANDIDGTTNDDTLSGDSGSDTIDGADGDDSISSGSGTDTVYGGAGNDTIDSAQQGGGATSDGDYVEGGTGDDSITGSGSDDTIHGQADDDTIDGGAGADSITGGTGNDSILGGAGNDTISGDDGADTIEGGAGDDSIDGGSGNDSLTGGDEGTSTVSDSINTGNYSDTSSGYTVTAQNVSGGALTSASVSNVSTSGGGLGASGAVSSTDSGQNNQLAYDQASGLSERLIVQFDEDVTSASFSFQSLFTDSFGEEGHWAIYDDGVLVAEADFTESPSGSGTGTVDLSGFGAFDQIIFTALEQTDFTDGSDYVITDISYTMSVTETSDDTIAGGAGADTILGGSGDDSISGGDDADSIEGGAGNDSIYGDAGDDTLSGGGGDDQIWSSGGNDSIDGGSGADTIWMDEGAGNRTIQGGETGVDYDTVDFRDGGTTSGVDVTFTGNEQGTFAYQSGSGTGTFSEIERIDGTGYGDNIDASATTTGTEIEAGGGDDTVTGGQGDDRMLGEEDADTFIVEDNFGNDTIVGGEGGTDDDTIDLSSLSGPVTVTYTGDEAGTITDGSDTISFSEIENLTLTDQADVVDATADSVGANIDAGGGNDTVTGGSGADTLISGDGQDWLSGGSGDDSLVGNSTDDFSILDGGAGADTLDGSAGMYDVAQYYNSTDGVDVDLTDGTAESGGDAQGDTLIGIEQVDGSNTGDDTIVGDNSLYQIKGWGGNDSLTGGSNDNEIHGGAGSDTVDGGGGDDTLSGGTGDDSITGGTGNDTFQYTPGDGHDTISDFNAGNTGTLSDGDNTNNDFIDLSGHYDNLSELYADQADDGILNQSNATDSKGRSVDYSDNTQFGAGDSLTFQGASADNSSFTEENTGVVCFTSGTAIRTPRGDRLIDDLRVGDLVCTLDNGPQPIRWIGRRELGPAELAASPHLRPILIRRGVMGAERDLLVSPQHGMLMPDQTLVRAKFLAEAKGNPVRVAHGRPSVCYIHLLFDAHQIIFAENTRSESLYPGKMAFAAMGPATQAEFEELFPDLNPVSLQTPEDWYGASARTYLKRRIALQDGGRISL